MLPPQGYLSCYTYRRSGAGGCGGRGGALHDGTGEESTAYGRVGYSRDAELFSGGNDC